MQYPDKAEIEKLRERLPEGTRVRLIIWLTIHILYPMVLWGQLNTWMILAVSTKNGITAECLHFSPMLTSMK